MSRPPLLFTTSPYVYMLDKLCDAGGYEAGAVERKHFADGERYLRLLTEVSDRDVILLGGSISEDATTELLDLGCGLVNYGARRLSLLIPYFGYSTMERAAKPGEVVTAKTRAQLVSTIPPASMGNRVFLVDLHSEGIAYYFDSGIRPVHVNARPLVLQAARRLGGEDFVVGCTDAGRAKWVESLALDLGVPAAYVYKRRLESGGTEVTGVSAHVTGKPVVIYDDMIRTGGSLLGAARAYQTAGATSISAICTHGLFPGRALDKLQQSGIFDRIVCTDTHPRATELQGDFLEVVDIAPVLAASFEDSQ